MLDYIIIMFLISLAVYCHVLAIRLKKLKFGAFEMNRLINKLKLTLISAQTSRVEMNQIVERLAVKLKEGKADTNIILDDLKFMVQRAETIINNLHNIIQNDRRMKNSDQSYNFRELLVKIAK